MQNASGVFVAIIFAIGIIPLYRPRGTMLKRGWALMLGKELSEARPAALAAIQHRNQTGKVDGFQAVYRFVALFGEDLWWLAVEAGLGLEWTSYIEWRLDWRQANPKLAKELYGWDTPPGATSTAPVATSTGGEKKRRGRGKQALSA